MSRPAPDILDEATVTYFDERAPIEAFARAAAEEFSTRPLIRTYTNGDLAFDLLAIKWGSADQAVLVVRLDPSFRPLIFGDCVRKTHE